MVLSLTEDARHTFDVKFHLIAILPGRGGDCVGGALEQLAVALLLVPGVAVVGTLLHLHLDAIAHDLARTPEGVQGSHDVMEGAGWRRRCVRCVRGCCCFVLFFFPAKKCRVEMANELRAHGFEIESLD